MLYHNWMLFLVLLGIGPFLLLSNRYFHKRLHRTTFTPKAAAESSSRLTSLARGVGARRARYPEFHPAGAERKELRRSRQPASRRQCQSSPSGDLRSMRRCWA